MPKYFEKNNIWTSIYFKYDFVETLITAIIYLSIH